MLKKKELLWALTVVILLLGVVGFCRYGLCPSLPLSIGPTAVLAALGVESTGEALGQRVSGVPSEDGVRTSAVMSLRQLAGGSRSGSMATMEQRFSVREAHGGVHIEAPSGKTYSATLYDGIGNEVGSRVVLQGGNTTLTVNALQPGLYFVKLGSAGGNVFIRKLIVNDR